MLVFAGVLVLCIASVNSVGICEGLFGVQWKMDPVDCSKFYWCMNGREYEFKCPADSVVNQESRSCVPKGSSYDTCTFQRPQQLVPSICDMKAQTRIAHPESCAKFYDCSNKKTSGGDPEVEECKYPFLFDEETMRCEHFSTTKCGRRFEPKNQCDYDSNKCRSAHCIPCHIRYPSCDGFGDGMNPWKGREGSPNYVICQEERVVYQGECPRYADTQHIFHPVKKLCVDFKEMDM